MDSNPTEKFIQLGKTNSPSSLSENKSATPISSSVCTKNGRGVEKKLITEKDESPISFQSSPSKIRNN